MASITLPDGRKVLKDSAADPNSKNYVPKTNQDISTSLNKVKGGLDTLTSAKGAGFDVTNKTTVKEAQDYLNTNPYQQTSTGYRQKTGENTTKFQDMQTQMESVSQNQQKKNAEDKKNKTEKDALDPADPFYEEKLQEQTLREQGESELNDIRKTYASLEKYADQAHSQLLQSIQTIYGARLDKMADSNKRLLATKGVANIRQGRSRYAPQLAEGILTDEELAGHERLAAIEGEMLMQVAKAEQARASGKAVSFNNMYSQIEKTIARMNEQIEQNYTMAINRDKEIRAAAQEERAASKASLDDMITRAESAAPAIIEQLEGLSLDERTAFLEAYAERTGIDTDVLMGELATATNDVQYKKLQIANIENQIYNRNRTQDRLSQEDDEDISEDQAIAKVSTELNKVRGADGYISPEDYNLMRDLWRETGFSASKFDKEFGDLRNPSHGGYKTSEAEVS